jgi:hypothetical protein
MSMQVPELSVRMPAEAGRRSHRYLRRPAPLHFPESEEVPETKPSLERRIVLYNSVRRACGAEVTIGSDQFVYYDPTTPTKRLAPDVFVRLGAPDTSFNVWFTWERGAPHLGVEIISTSDSRESVWDEKLERYRTAGICEVVAFDATDRAPLRVWDLVGGDMVERAQDDPELRWCETLKLWWVTVQDPQFGPMLRLAHDREGSDLLLTDQEAEVKQREEAVRAREAEAKQRAEKERLEAELVALRAQLAGTRARPRKRRT